MPEFRSKFGGRGWVVTDAGVVTGDPLRTKGDPVSARAYLSRWGAELRNASEVTGVPLAILVATVATENGPAKGDPRGPRGLRIAEPRIRKEPGYVSNEETPHRVSVGPCHVLLSTARAAMDDDTLDVPWLAHLTNNILAAATYIASQEPLTRFDPVLVAAAYNSGGVYDASDPGSRFHSPWHVRSWPGHIDRFAAWYGDACEVLKEMERAA